MTTRSHKDGGLIAAVSTAAGRGAIAIVRLSGEGAAAAAASLFGWTPEKLKPRYMYYGTLTAADGVRDNAVLVYFERGKSYTGEQSAEIHCHGSPVVTAAVLKVLCDNGARLAERGEFTRRAYCNGKLDLTQAEGIIDLIDSGSTAAAKAAYSQADGALFHCINEIAQTLTDAAAAVGAAIDYPDEVEEMPDVDLQPALERLRQLKAGYPAGSAAVSGVKVALVGKPNAGKSTLFNALVGRDRSIVTDVAGTTRDTVNDGYEYKGVRFELIDTAGIHEARDEPERQGIERSRRAAEQADVVLEIDDAGAFTIPGAVRVQSKADLDKTPAGDLTVSGLTGTGVRELKEYIYRRAGDLVVQDVTLTNLRQYEAVCEALDATQSAADALQNAAPDCAASDLHAALTALGRVTGVTAAQTVVNRIFERFCVGK